MRRILDATECCVAIDGSPRSVDTPKYGLGTSVSTMRPCLCDANEFTESVAVTDLGPPAADKMHLVLRDGCHLWIPVAHQIVVLFDLVWFDIVEHDRMHVFAACQYLREAPLDVFVKIATLRRSVDERRQRAALLLATLLLSSASRFCD